MLRLMAESGAAAAPELVVLFWSLTGEALEGLSETAGAAVVARPPIPAAETGVW